MGEDLRKCNIKFRELVEQLKRKRSINKDEESLAYFFFLAGYQEGSGMTQAIC